ncbi:MAG: amidohydrolase [Mizugakiibacter sp.]|uniref:amidohydrolase n=1 Tax=Mizugakiibacter sp. TaxID=1972610 RepID=UPI0031C92410|nr:amidohydrolase [Xanthomonadaceae bacterium]
MRRTLRHALLALVAGAALQASLAQAATLLVGARVHTMDPAKPDADALAWDDAGRILAVGTAPALVSRYPDARRIDVHGATVIPGLIDAHGHTLGLGMALLDADLVGASSEDEAIARLRKHAATLPPGAWLRGRGWDQNRWPGKRFPTAADLDAAFPDRPVYLERIDGHAAWVNSAAMKRALKPLDGDWQPDGGRIERLDGKATGVLVDRAVELVEKAIPPLDAAQKRHAYQVAFATLVSVGLTGVHDPGISLDDLHVLQGMADHGELPLRLYTMADGDHAALAWLCEHGAYAHPSGRLQMRALKLYMDGALGSRGAALLADYSDDPGNLGILVTEPERYREIVARAHRCGLQVATHAIGDRGNRLVLDTYAEVLGKDAATTDHRWRVEHAQVVALEDIPRFAALHLIASMQPTHATSDMPWAEARLGAERIRGAYAWQRFIHAGVHMALGSDFPVEYPNPMLGLYAAITRQDLAGQPPGGWYPDQRLTREQALAGFTRDAAWAAFMENEVGMLKAGMRADFLILPADPMTIAPRAIAGLKPMSTWVDGKPVYRAR